MQRFILCSGVHGKASSLELLRQLTVARRPDAIFFAGGISPPERKSVSRLTAWSLSAEDMRFVENFFTTLGNLGVFAAVIPGPVGEPLEEFYRLGMNAELEFPSIHIAHASLFEEANVAVTGIGGSIAEEALVGCDSYSRTTARYFLRSLERSSRPCKVLLLPEPPPGPLGGPEGNSLVGDLIDSLRPTLCVVAGSSQRQGIQRIASTLVVNPGFLAEGTAAWVDWTCAPEDQVVFLGPQATSGPGVGRPPCDRTNRDKSTI